MTFGLDDDEDPHEDDEPVQQDAEDTIRVTPLLLQKPNPQPV